MNHHAPVNLRDGDLNSVLMVLMKVFLNQGVLGDQKSQLNLDEMMDDQKMGDQKMIRLMMDGRLMDDQNYLVDLNFRDALPYAYSLISIEI
jgi:DNA polymerase II large subunit